MNFREFLQLFEVSDHAKGRLGERIPTALFRASQIYPELVPDPQGIIDQIIANIDIAETIYSVGKAFAVQLVPTFNLVLSEKKTYSLKNLPDLRREPSNGDMIVGIF